MTSYRLRPPLPGGNARLYSREGHRAGVGEGLSAGSLAHGAADSACLSPEGPGSQAHPDGGPPGRCEVLEHPLESHRVGAGVDGHEVMPRARRRLVNRLARAQVQIGFREVRAAPRGSAHPAGLLACLLCVLGVSFLYWLIYRCLIRCELLPRRL